MICNASLSHSPCNPKGKKNWLYETLFCQNHIWCSVTIVLTVCFSFLHYVFVPCCPPRKLCVICKNALKAVQGPGKASPKWALNAIYNMLMTKGFTGTGLRSDLQSHTVKLYGKATDVL